MIVDLFIPCYMDQAYPEAAHATVKVLEKAGCGVNYNVEQTCCGMPSFHEGYTEYCKEVGEKLIKEFQNDRYIVSPGGSCVNMIKNYYPEMFHNSVLHNEYKHVKKKIHELSEFIVNVLNKQEIESEFSGKICFIDNCSAMRELNIVTPPRTLLTNINGVTLVEPEDADTCCGFGGTLSNHFEDISTKLAEKKTEHILRTGAEYVVSTDITCLLHLEGYFRKHSIPLKVMHLSEVLAA
jgi:L-lactate dehydrogenase complex protein LldE